MRILRRMRVMDAVYWPVSSVDETGRVVYADPVDMKVRWVDKAEIFLTRSGQQGVSKSVVYGLPTLQEDGVLRKGTVAGLPNAVKPAQNSGLWKPFRSPGSWTIRAVDRIPELRNPDLTDEDRTLTKAIL